MNAKPNAAEHRLTLAQTETLMRLASQMSIRIKPEVRDKEFVLELSGEGFSVPEPVTLPLTSAYARLLAEVCGGLAPWIPFSPAEACETTLFGLSEEAINTAIRKYRYRLAMRLTTRFPAARRSGGAGRTGCRLFSSIPAQMASQTGAETAVTAAG